MPACAGSSPLSEWTTGSGGNGHFYKVVCATLSWEEASAAAQAAGGYLATLTSSDENAFVFNLVNDTKFWTVNSFNGANGPYLGGYQPQPCNSEPSGCWTWVTGETWSYTNWAGGEPNDYGGSGSENQLGFYNCCPGTPTPAATWNDLSNEIVGYVIAYVVEWDTSPSVSCPGSSPQVQWTSGTGANNHYYQVVCTDTVIDWDTAKAAAETAGGHLATISSAEENLFVFNLIDYPAFWSTNGINEPIGPWIGGVQPTCTPEPACGWSWTTGETWSYTNWGCNQPDNYSGDDDSVHYFLNPDCDHERSPYWGDGEHGATITPVIAYVIEWDGESTPTPTPTATATQTATATATATATQTATATATATATQTATNTPTATATATQTATATATQTATNTPTVTATATQTATSTATATNTVTSTRTPTSTATAKARATNTMTATSSPTKTATPPPQLALGNSVDDGQDDGTPGSSNVTDPNVPWTPLDPRRLHRPSLAGFVTNLLGESRAQTSGTAATATLPTTPRIVPPHTGDGGLASHGSGIAR